MKDSPSQTPHPAAEAQQLTDAAAVRSAMLTMCAQARHIVRLSSHRLNPDLFDTAELRSALSHLARAFRDSEVRILVADSRSLAEHGHRLLSLSRRLSSKVVMRRVALPEHEQLPEYLLADDWGVITFGSSEQAPTMVSLRDRPANRNLAEAFDALWQRSQTPVELRQIVL